MMQFVSGSILDAPASIVAVPVTHSDSANPGVPVDLRLTKCFAETWVRLKRHLRTQRLEPGSLWIDDKSPNPVVLLATLGDSHQISIPNLRKALRRLGRWADRNQLDQIHVAGCSTGQRLGCETVFRQIAFQLLVDSRCRFHIHEPPSPDQFPVRIEGPRTPLSRFVDCSESRLTAGSA